MVFSYFYNLSVMGYSLKGNNEFRIYDFVGIIIIYLFVKFNGVLVEYIKSIPPFKYFYYFLLWATFSLLFTLVFSVALGRILWFIQSVLYLFHFWVFFLTSVFISIYIHDLKNLKRLVSFLLLVSVLAFLIIILQNLGIIPFLWSDIYYKGYLGFLSGTFGPNKVVVGISSLIILILCIGLLNEKRVKINKSLLLTAMISALFVLLISGSRTSYLGLLSFGMFYFIKNTIKFFVSILVLWLLFLGVTFVKPELVEKINETFENRVENKIKNPNAFKEGDVDDLYEDLGSGRKGLSLKYIEYLFENPYIIPLGVGFNNRLMIGFSAHNIYLSLINELGLLGVFLYFRWMLSFLRIKMAQFKQMEIALKGVVFAMLVTLFFGEHIYVYRPLFGLSGLFMLITVLLLSPVFYFIGNKENHESRPQ